jgi:hypothetical protein
VQVSLKLQKRLAASVLGCGKRKIWLDPTEINEISMANSRASANCQRAWGCGCGCDRTGRRWGGRTGEGGERGTGNSSAVGWALTVPFVAVAQAKTCASS